MQPSSHTDTTDDLCSELCASSMPELSNALSLCNITKLSKEEIDFKVSSLRTLRRRIQIYSNPPLCPLEYGYNETLNDRLRNISVDDLESDTRSTTKLVHLGWAVLSVYSFNVEKNSQLLTTIVRILTMSHTTAPNLSPFLNKLWMLRSFELPVNLGELIIEHSPHLLESLVIDLIANVFGTEHSDLTVCVEKPEIQRWLLLCAKSRTFFQRSFSLIHQMLLSSRGNIELLKLVLIFRKHVSSLIKQDIAYLYPTELQRLAMFMNLSPDHCTKQSMTNDVLEPLLDGLLRTRATHLCLLSHYPEWEPYLSRYAFENNELPLLSKNFSDTLSIHWKYGSVL